MWCYAGEGGSALLKSGLQSGIGLSSLQQLNVKWQHTELRLVNLLEECSGWCAAVLSDMVG